MLLYGFSVSSPFPLFLSLLNAEVPIQLFPIISWQCILAQPSPSWCLHAFHYCALTHWRPASPMLLFHLIRYALEMIRCTDKTKYWFWSCEGHVVTMLSRFFHPAGPCEVLAQACMHRAQRKKAHPALLGVLAKSQMWFVWLRLCSRIADFLA